MSIAELSNSVLMDMAHLFCGQQLGDGMSRKVYVLASDPTKVVKIEANAGYFQNIIEWETWQALGHTPHGKFLAPCRSISPCGIVLIQERVDALPKTRRRTKLPDFLCDFKATNYGLYKGRVVCCDYGTNLLLHVGADRSKMRKPSEWYTR